MKMKMFAALTAGLMLCGMLTAPVSAAGSAGNDPLQFEAQYTLWHNSVVNDSGLFTSIQQDGRTGFLSTNLEPAQHEALVRNYDSDEMAAENKSLALYQSIPYDRAVFLTESDAQNEAALAIAEKYVPAQAGSIRQRQVVLGSGSGTLFEVQDTKDQDNRIQRQKTLQALKAELEQNNLISVFYYPEQLYTQKGFHVPYLTGYTYDIDSADVPFYRAAVQNYLDTNQIACTIQTEEDEYEIRYKIIPDEKISLPEHFALAVRFRRDLGIEPYTVDMPLSDLPVGAVCNISGDVNMDGAVDVADAEMTLLEYVKLVLARHAEGDLTPEQRQLALVIPQKYWSQEKYITDENSSLILCAQTILNYYTAGLADASVRKTDISDWVEEAYQKRT